MMNYDEWLIMNIKNLIRNLWVVKDVLRVSLNETYLTLFRNREFSALYIESRMLVVAHSLEKGLSMREIKNGFGVKKANNLYYYIKKYMKYNPESCAFCLIESLGILKAYQTYQKNISFDLGDLNDSIDILFQNLSEKQKEKLADYRYGIENLRQGFFLKGKSNFYEIFIKSRRSARNYSDEPISEITIKKVIELANLSPTACNRQPTKVYVALGEENARKVGELLGNKAFTQYAKNFAIITCDRAYFAGDEHYQWYINGGIYLMSFVNSLHSYGIGSCIMQWFAFDKNEKKLKRLLGIKKSEAIIASVSLGYYPEELTCICAQRKSADETLYLYRHKS